MKTDRELDARIDAEIFGVERKLCTIHHAYSCCGRTTKHYSTQIADAWLVVEKLGEDGWSCNIVRHEKDDNLCEFWGGKMGNKHWREIVNHQPTTPLAICLAALAVVERRE